MKDSLLASFQVLQNSRVLVCLDSRGKKPPRWLRKKNFKLTDMQLPGAPEGCTYVVYAKLYREGDEASVYCRGLERSVNNDGGLCVAMPSANQALARFSQGFREVFARCSQGFRKAFASLSNGLGDASARLSQGSRKTLARLSQSFGGASARLWRGFRKAFPVFRMTFRKSVAKISHGFRKAFAGVRGSFFLAPGKVTSLSHKTCAANTMDARTTML